VIGPTYKTAHIRLFDARATLSEYFDRIYPIELSTGIKLIDILIWLKSEDKVRYVFHSH
jgi:hypothetical protein